MLSGKLKKIFGHLDPNNPPIVCPIRDILSSVTDKWSILVLLFLGGHTKLRFNQLKSLIYGISSKSLSEKLKILEKDGYIVREDFLEVPIRVEYRLTSLGLSHLEQLIKIAEWASENMNTIIKNRVNNSHLS
ncbi:MAG: helix-turn-helix transcriptional regulator [Leptospiraceae bacterium]|nr:helix-turn-helix transcriptional regulator [Leptospiraceae bacterium]